MGVDFVFASLACVFDLLSSFSLPLPSLLLPFSHSLSLLSLPYSPLSLPLPPLSLPLPPLSLPLPPLSLPLPPLSLPQITPVQRIPRYMLLVDQLLKATWDTHRDIEKLTNALNSIKQIAFIVDNRCVCVCTCVCVCVYVCVCVFICNVSVYVSARERECVRAHTCVLSQRTLLLSPSLTPPLPNRTEEVERMTKMAEIEESISGKFDTLREPNRRYVMEGELMVVSTGKVRDVGEAGVCVDVCGCMCVRMDGWAGVGGVNGCG